MTSSSGRKVLTVYSKLKINMTVGSNTDTAIEFYSETCLEATTFRAAPTRQQIREQQVCVRSPAGWLFIPTTQVKLCLVPAFYKYPFWINLPATFRDVAKALNAHYKTLFQGSERKENLKFVAQNIDALYAVVLEAKTARPTPVYTNAIFFELGSCREILSTPLFRSFC